jgi:mono/diheme cytochrome c family protein
MNTKFTISFILTIGAFALTLYLLVVVVIAHDEMNPEKYAGCGITDYVAPISQETTFDHPGAKIFNANCKACHRINQKLIGPALAGVTDRYDSMWLAAWIRNSSKMIAEGDPRAVAIFNEYNQVQMTSFTSLTDEELKNLLDYLRLASQESMRPVPAPAKVGV